MERSAKRPKDRSGLQCGRHPRELGLLRLLSCLCAALHEGPVRSLGPAGLVVLVVNAVHALALALAPSLAAFAAALASKAFAPSFAAVFALALSRLLGSRLLVLAAALARSLPAIVPLALAILANLGAWLARKNRRGWAKPLRVALSEAPVALQRLPRLVLVLALAALAFAEGVEVSTCGRPFRLRHPRRSGVRPGRCCRSCCRLW